MSSKSWREQWVVRVLTASAVVTLVAAACASRDHPRPTCADLADGGALRFEVPEASVYYAVPSTDAQPVTAYGLEADPGPTCVNCQQEDGIELMPIADFEQGFAPAWFNYGEPGAVIEPRQTGDGVSAEGVSVSTPDPYWGLQAADLRRMPGGARCGSNFALHLQGGPFVAWGGGYATQFATVRGPENVTRFCAEESSGPSGVGIEPRITGDTCNFWMTPVSGQPSRLGIDASEFDGVAFWARRGPGGQSTLRISLLDSNTSGGNALSEELLAVEEGRAAMPACQRIVDCCRSCNERTHVFLDAGAPIDAGTELEPSTELFLGVQTDMRCHLATEPGPPLRFANSEEPDPAEFEVYLPNRQPPDAGEGGDDEDAGGGGGDEDAGDHWFLVENEDLKQQARNVWDQWNRDYKPCCPQTRAEDPLYGGNDAGECVPYVFQYDFSSGYYCHPDPTKPLPERNQNRCGDGFEATVTVDTEWKLFRVPWSELRRSTLGREAIDTTGIWQVSFFFAAGWLDTYVDDVGFYRERR